MIKIVKYHIGSTGKIEICKAFIIPCPYARKGQPHFTSIEEAESYIEDREKEKQNKINQEKEKAREISAKEAFDGNYMKNHLFKSAYSSNPEYRDFYDSLTGEESFGNEIAYSQKQIYAKWGFNAYLDRNPGAFFTEINDAQYKALSDYCDLYSNYHFENTPSKNLQPITISRAKNILKAYDTAREIGYSNNKVYFEALTTDPATSKNLFNKIKFDNEGRPTNLYFIGEEGLKDIDTFEAGKVSYIDTNNKLIYTEQNPFGFTLRLNKINPQGKEAKSRAIFAIDPDEKNGKISNEWNIIHSNEVDNESHLENDGSMRETISRGFHGFYNYEKFRTVPIKYFNNFIKEHNSKINGRGIFNKYEN